MIVCGGSSGGRMMMLMKEMLGCVRIYELMVVEVIVLGVIRYRQGIDANIRRRRRFAVSLIT